MRLSLLAALLSTVLMPVAANAQRHDRGDHDRGNRGARVERPARPAATPRPAHRPEQRASRAIQRADPDRARRNADVRAALQHRGDRPRPGASQHRPDRNNRGHDWNRSDRNDRDHQWNRGDRNDRDHNWNRSDRNGRDHQWNRGDRNDRDHRWDRSRADWNDHARGNGRFDFNRRWRDDRRYNWRDWRTRNRSAYHLPRYYAPHGWSYGYRRFSIGFRLNSLLFGSGYWINDPYDYRLPPAYGPYRWVRYYDDALLVDITTGVVVDVVYDIFW